MGALSGKVAIVTGAARGLGRAYALRLAKLGADVVISDVNLQAAARIGEQLTGESVMAEVQALGVRSLGVEGDLREPATAHLIAERALEAFGRIDILVNNAGVAVARGSGTLATETKSDAFDYLIDVNLKSVQLCCAAVAPTMKRNAATSSSTYHLKPASLFSKAAIWRSMELRKQASPILRAHSPPNLVPTVYASTPWHRESSRQNA